MAHTRYISPEYFRAIGIPLRQGRFFSDHDRDNSVPVIIISEAMAHRFLPGENPIGKRLTPSFHVEEGAREIVGVVGDVKSSGLDVDSAAMMYMPYKQAPRPFIASWCGLPRTRKAWSNLFRRRSIQSIKSKR